MSFKQFAIGTQKEEFSEFRQRIAEDTPDKVALLVRPRDVRP